MHAGENRAFEYALISSVVLHGLALFGLPDPEWLRVATAAPPRPLVATLVELPPVPAADARVEPAPPRAPPATPRAAPAPTRAAPAPTRAAPARRPLEASSAKPRRRHDAQPLPIPAPASRPAALSELEPVQETAPSATPSQQEQAAVGSAPPAPSEPPSPGPVARVDANPAPSAGGAPVIDSASVDRFRLEMILAAQRTKRYPRAAMDNNWQGRAHVRLTFSAEGRAASIAIVKSSGHAILDRQAIETMTRAVLPVPPPLLGKAFEVEIPISFELRAEAPAS